jgi:hypothetical protein
VQILPAARMGRFQSTPGTRVMWQTFDLGNSTRIFVRDTQVNCTTLSLKVLMPPAPKI